MQHLQAVQVVGYILLTNPIFRLNATISLFSQYLAALSPVLKTLKQQGGIHPADF